MSPRTWRVSDLTGRYRLIFCKKNCVYLNMKLIFLGVGFSRGHPGFLKQLHKLEHFGLMNNLLTFFFFFSHRCSGKQSVWEHNKNESYGGGGSATRGLAFRDKQTVRRLLKLHFHWPASSFFSETAT